MYQRGGHARNQTMPRQAGTTPGYCLLSPWPSLARSRSPNVPKPCFAAFAAVVLHGLALLVDRQRLGRAAQPAVAIDADDLDLELAADRVALAQIAAARRPQLDARDVAARALAEHARRRARPGRAASTRATLTLMRLPGRTLWGASPPSSPRLQLLELLAARASTARCGAPGDRRARRPPGSRRLPSPPGWRA